MKRRNGDPEQSEYKHYVSCFLKRSMAPLPLTSTMTRRKQANTPLLPLLHPVVYKLLRWRTDHRRHRLGVNRVPFIGVDTARGPIRQPKHGWGRGRPMLSEPLRLTRSPGSLQTTVKLGKLPENMSPCVCDIRVSGGKSADVQYEVARRSLHVVLIQILQTLQQLGAEVKFSRLRTFSYILHCVPYWWATFNTFGPNLQMDLQSNNLFWFIAQISTLLISAEHLAISTSS